jgi:hypothetical protein
LADIESALRRQLGQQYKAAAGRGRPSDDEVASVFSKIAGTAHFSDDHFSLCRTALRTGPLEGQLPPLLQQALYELVTAAREIFVLAGLVVRAEIQTKSCNGSHWITR